MTDNWKYLPKFQDVAEAQAQGWEIEIQTDAGNDKYCPFKAWDGRHWNTGYLFRGRPRQPKITVELPVADVVRLQNAADGLWAHFRVGKGYAYSINLDADKMGNRFANEYRAAVGSDAPQPKMKKVKFLCWCSNDDAGLHWVTEGTDWPIGYIRLPKLDLEGEVPDEQ